MSVWEEFKTLLANAPKRGRYLMLDEKVVEELLAKDVPLPVVEDFRYDPDSGDSE